MNQELLYDPHGSLGMLIADTVADENTRTPEQELEEFDTWLEAEFGITRQQLIAYARMSKL